MKPVFDFLGMRFATGAAVASRAGRMFRAIPGTSRESSSGSNPDIRDPHGLGDVGEYLLVA